MSPGERIGEISKKIQEVKAGLQNLYLSIDAIGLLILADHSVGLLQFEFDVLKKENNELRSRLVALKTEHDELEKQHSDRGQYLAEREIGIGMALDAIEKAIVALNQTKKIFKSKTLWRIRMDLIASLPFERKRNFL